MAISAGEALEVALVKLCSLEKEFGDALALQTDETVRIAKGWILFWNSREFIASRSRKDCLAGNGPIFVSISGTVHCLPTHTHWQKVIEDL